jgi:hypothetical protein
LESLGRNVNLIDVQSATLMFALATALTTSQIMSQPGGKRSLPPLESPVVTQFGNTLLAKVNKDLLCESFAGGNQATAEERAFALARKYTAMYQQLGGNALNETFLASKIMGQWITTGNLRRFHSIKDSITGPEYTAVEVAELGKRNGELTQVIKKIRSYGVSSIIFPLEGTIPGYDAVYHEASDLDLPSLIGEQPLALIRITPADQPAEAKVDLSLTHTGGIKENLQRLELGEGDPLLTMDQSGELHLGYGISENSVPLRILFEHDNAAAAYEELRARLLSSLFDAVTPALIVGRLTPSGPPNMTGAGQSQSQAEYTPDTVVHRLVLPRIRYVQDQTMKQLRAEFAEALQAESAQALRAEQAAIAKTQIRQRWHKVSGFLRRLPVNARGASAAAVERAKEYFGPDFEMPDRYTFRKPHERGDRTKGVVAGHLAVQRTVVVDDPESAGE